MSDAAQPGRSFLGPLVVIGFGLILLCYFAPGLLRLTNAWPPAFLERRAQRKQVLERVQFAGGWSALRHDCDVIKEQKGNAYYVWFPRSTNALPPAVAALKPREVRAGGTEHAGGTSEVRIVHIKGFGFRSTDGHQPPYFGLEVVSGPGADSYRPAKSRYVDLRRELLTNNIYEVHD